MDDRFVEELELLENIYTNEEVGKVTCENGSVNKLIMTVHPATAGNVDEQYVRVQLHITVASQYPDVSPVLQIRNPRGLSENEVTRLDRKLNDCITEEQGNPVMMQLFELAREVLTDSNVPHGLCAICLCDFLDESRAFIRTECYHYFHSVCMSKYKSHWECEQREIERSRETMPAYQQEQVELFMCPECREELTLTDSLQYDDLADKESFVYVVSDEMRQQQQRWRQLFNKQKAQGGIIDLEYEKMKYRLPPPPPSPPPPEEEPSGENTDQADKETVKAVAAGTTDKLDVKLRSVDLKEESKPRTDKDWRTSTDRPASRRDNNSRGRGHYYRNNYRGRQPRNVGSESDRYPQTSTNNRTRHAQSDGQRSQLGAKARNSKHEHAKDNTAIQNEDTTHDKVLKDYAAGSMSTHSSEQLTNVEQQLHSEQYNSDNKPHSQHRGRGSKGRPYSGRDRGTRGGRPPHKTHSHSPRENYNSKAGQKQPQSSTASRQEPVLN